MADFNFDDLKKTFTDAAEVVTKKTSDFVSIQKLKGQIYALGHTVDKKYQELGAVVFDEYSQGEKINDESAVVCEEISQINANIADLREELAGKHGCKICLVCEAEVPLEGMFCMKCGAQMPEQDCGCESSDCECGSSDCSCEEGNPSVEAIKAVGEEVKKVGQAAAEEAGDKIKDVSEEVKKVSKVAAEGATKVAQETKEVVKGVVEEVKEELKKSEE